MNKLFNLANAIRVVNRQVFDPKQLNEDKMQMLLSGVGHELQLEPVSLEDVEQTYLLDTLVADDQLLSAITTKHNLLARSMRSIVKALNTSLSSAGLTAGSDVVQQDTTANGKVVDVVGNAFVSKPRKAGVYAIISALIPISDGQSISIIFYAPDDDPLKISKTDTLIAFRFLLNKRDITHIVAPDNGKDISLRQTTTGLAEVISKNSTKFIANQEKVTGEKTKLEETQTALEAAVSEAENLADAMEMTAPDVARTDKTISSLETKLNNLKNSNKLLEDEIAAAGPQPGSEQPGATDEQPGDAVDQEIARKADIAKMLGGANFWYGLRARPLGGGAQPAGHSAVLTKEEAERKFSDVDDKRNIRWGAIAYGNELSDKQVSDYELVKLSAGAGTGTGSAAATETVTIKNGPKITKLVEEMEALGVAITYSDKGPGDDGELLFTLPESIRTPVRQEFKRSVDKEDKQFDIDGIIEDMHEDYYLEWKFAAYTYALEPLFNKKVQGIGKTGSSSSSLRMDKEVRKTFIPKKGTSVFLQGTVDGTEYATFEVTPENEKYRVTGSTDNLSGLYVVVSDFDGIAEAVTGVMGLTMPGAESEVPTEDMLVSDIHDKMDNNDIIPQLNRSIASNSDGTFSYSTLDDVIDVITYLLNEDRYKGLSVSKIAVAKRIEAERQARSLENEAKAVAQREEDEDAKNEARFNELVPLFKALKGNGTVPKGWEQYDVTDHVDAFNESDVPVPFSIITSPAGLIDDGGELAYKLTLDPDNTNNFSLSPVDGLRIANGISSFDNALKLMQEEYKKRLPEFVETYGEDNPDYSAQLNADIKALQTAAPKKPQAKKAKSWQQFFDASDTAKIESAIQGGLDVTFFAFGDGGKPTLNFDTPRGYIGIDLTVEEEREKALMAIDKWLADAPVRARKLESDQLSDLLRNKRAPKGWKLKQDHSMALDTPPFWELDSPAGKQFFDFPTTFFVKIDENNPGKLKLTDRHGDNVDVNLSSFADVKKAAQQRYIENLPRIAEDNGRTGPRHSPQLLADIEKLVPVEVSEPEQDQGTDPVLDKHLDTMKRIANNEMGMQEASAALEEIGAYLEANDKVDEFEGELTQAVNAVTEMVKAQFAKVG